MKKHLRKLFAVLLSVMLIVSVFPGAIAETQNLADVANVNNVNYATLAEAVSAAQDGDTVTLLSNVALSAPLDVTKSITIDCADFEITPVNDFNGHAAFMLGTTGSTSLESIEITVKNGTFKGFNTSHGVIRVEGVTADVIDCTFVGNTQTNQQNYAVVNYNLAAGKVSGCTFKNNICWEVLDFNSQLKYVYESAEKYVVSGNVVEDNTVNGNGLLYYNLGVGITIENNKFNNNELTTTQNNAGVFYFGSCINCAILNNEFNGNKVEGSTARSGVLVLEEGPTVTGNAFINNKLNANATYHAMVVNKADGGVTDLSGNYWGGGEPNFVDAKATSKSEYTSYYTTYVGGVLGGLVTSGASYVAEVGGVEYETLADAIEAAQSGETIRVIADISDEAVTVNKNLTITGTATLNNVSITMSGTTVELTVSGLNFTGSSYINANNGAALTVTDVTATVAPTKLSGRAAFIVAGTSELSHGLKLVVKNNVIKSAQSKTDFYSAAIFGWRYIDDGSEISGNTFGAEDNRYTFIGVKFMNAIDDAKITIANNTIYGTSESYVLLAFDLYQNCSRANAYTVVSKNNTINATIGNSYPVIAFYLEGNTGFSDATNVTLIDNGTTLNGNPITLSDIDVSDVGSDYDKYFGVDVVTDANGKIISGTFGGDMDTLAENIAGGYEVVNGVVSAATNYVAEVDGVKYETLAAAVAAAQNGDVITMLQNVELSTGVTVPAGLTVTLELNGKTISRTTDAAQGSAAITNKGNLTIQDSVGGGKVSSFAGNPDNGAFPGYANNTITNKGTLTIKSGTIENATEYGKAAFPIDNYSYDSDAYLYIEGGVITGRGAIRQYAPNTNYKNEVYIKGGTVTGTSYALWVQNLESGNPSAKTVISGGELSRVLLSPSTNFDVSITGGKISTVEIWEADETNTDRNPAGFISGGTFSADVSEFVADGFELKDNGDGTFGTIVATPKAAAIGNVQYDTLADAVAAAQNGDVITMLQNVELSTGVTVPAGLTVTLELNGKTISRTTDAAQGSAAITNKGNLTIQDSVGGGKVSSFAGNPDNGAFPGYANNTITNKGTLTIKSGTIENATEYGKAAFPIDNYSYDSDAYLYIEGGVITGRGAIRQYAPNTNYKNEVYIKGGTVTGTSYALWVQNLESGNPSAKTVISGGELSRVLLSPSTNFDVSITGGKISTVEIWEADETNPSRNPAGFISGGTFSADVSEFVADGFELKDNGDGTFGTIVATPKEVAAIGNVKYTTLADAVAEAQSGDVIKLLDNVYEPTMSVILEENIILDVQTYTLTVARLTCYEGAYVIGASYNKKGTGYGKVVVPKNRFLAESESAYLEHLASGDYYVLPVWDDDNDCYIFGRYYITENFTGGGLAIDEANNKFTLYFQPQGSGAVIDDFFADGVLDNNVEIIIRISWISAYGDEVVQDYKYGTEMIKAWTQGRGLGITFTGYQECTNISATAMVVSGTGVTIYGETHTINTQN